VILPGHLIPLDNVSHIGCGGSICQRAKADQER